VGKRFQEVVQTGHHLLYDRYLAYSDPRALRHGRSVLLGGALVDPSLRQAARRLLKDSLTSPSKLRERLYHQSLVVIQPIDMMADGETNMCDGCPDMTVHNGELVWSCRLEERLRYGCFLTCAPKQEAAEQAPPEHEVIAARRLA
jgi:hypothetical protein